MPGRQLIMDFEVTPTSHTLEAYRARGGYATIEKALKSMQPIDVTKEVTASGLLGHGGAAFPVGRKWSVMKPGDGQPHYLCCNADEGEPGTFKDRWILENAPHLLVESMLLASYALGVRNAFVYIRGEFDLPWRRIQGAIDEAYAAGLLGAPLLGTDFVLDIVVYRGAGSYVCGEASGLITSIEGRKPYPRNRPPRLTVKGLYQCPTVINNVETLANVTNIIRDGAEAFRKVGTAKSPGTALVSISGHIAKPGVYEVEYGYPWVKFLDEDCGGMLNGAKLKCVVPGGISTKVLTRAEIEPLTLSHESVNPAGSGLGSGGMIAIAEGTCMVRLLQVLLRFYHHESCGQCTPCREGMGWMHKIIDRIVDGKGVPEDIDRLYAISYANDGTTICGMGDAAGYATIGILNKYRDEFEYYIMNKRSRCDGRLECPA
ncbi:MAG TPA: NADH-quinone oxidoreductase subunit NuoF [Usitatibacteraceae bacterium]|nr:NADH-quinone oxidoreductase subunit NuoF [Usitatibacteraceae bacterium]